MRLRDGREVVLREAGPADVPSIVRLYGELSPGSFRSRFFSSRPAPPVVARLARIDVARGAVCLIAAMASEPGRLAAEARYIPDAEDAGELALTVLDDFQGLGLGGRMLGALLARAARAGLARLSAVVDVSNGPMLHLLTRRGWVLTEPADECLVVRVEVSATGGMPGWPRAATGRRVLVERRGWFEDPRVAALRADGNDVRQCAGPDLRSGRPCPLVEAGRCRLAEDADRIVSLLPSGNEACVAVAEAHRRLWPGKLTGLSCPS